MRLAFVLLLALVVATAPGCASARGPYSAADHAADRAALLQLHEQARAAHVERRADLLVGSQADTLLSVSRGRVSSVPREHARASFQRYFGASTFDAWDDVAPPIIRISADGRMAWVVVDKRVHVRPRVPAAGASAEAPVERVRYAWLSVYEKRGGEWRLTAIASTDRPDST